MIASCVGLNGLTEKGERIAKGIKEQKREEGWGSLAWADAQGEKSNLIAKQRIFEECA
jgi:hypothetical protein